MSDYVGPWLVRAASGQPAARAVEPLLVRDLDELGHTLAGMLAAISLMGPGEHCQISIDATRKPG